jgi:hypothetical protein
LMGWCLSAICFIVELFCNGVLNKRMWILYCVDATHQLTLWRPKWVIREPMSQNCNKSMRLNTDNSFMFRVFLIVYNSCIMQHINILIFCF